jgi:hypothetical protein
LRLRDRGFQKKISPAADPPPPPAPGPAFRSRHPLESNGIGTYINVQFFFCCSPHETFLLHPGRLVINARNAHLGPRDGKHTKAKSQKKSAQRREMMFENSISQVDPFPARRLPTIPSTTAVPDTQHNIKHAATLQWVRPCFVRCSPSPTSLVLTTCINRPRISSRCIHTAQRKSALGRPLKNGRCCGMLLVPWYMFFYFTSCFISESFPSPTS